jgi:starch synthase (maltosyl-transferring)
MSAERKPRKNDGRSRLVIEGITPQIDGGRFPIKRTIGEDVIVEADIFADGHDKVAAALKYRPGGGGSSTERAQRAREGAERGERAPASDRAGVWGGAPLEEDWREAPMRELGNDRWQAGFRVDTIGRYEYTVEAWIDTFDTWRQGLKKKFEAGLDVEIELLEGAALVRDTLGELSAAAVQPIEADDTGIAEAEAVVSRARYSRLKSKSIADSLARGDQVSRVHAALDEGLARMMRERARRGRVARREPPLAVWVERERARYGAWYELFPRSAGTDPTRSATFDEAAERLPEIAAMGFDVLYLPPIHPIGTSFRKGRNNALAAEPGEPGSPWAIGGIEGGHTAIEPGLGTIEDFDRFVETARHLGLEIALDLAYQASPDHPYVATHPDWFRHRPDGTIQYAENPPKKYQDIYPFDFESADWQALWEELKNVVLYWVDHGVKIFRVDNPHTKPFAFWEWMLAEVRREHPETIFLAEAFTRPKVMKYLAKSGFSQSYTYFTWRNSKPELEEYFTELTQTDVREYMRPNLFANTPDILHEYLQHGGRPAFMIRLVLAATLGATYGIYSGFELCENTPARPGSEEYLDSEKYQYRPRNWNQPGHIKELIARVNRIRRESPSLHGDWRLQFHRTDNDHIICYSKTTPDLSDVTLVVVNLDYGNLQHGWIQAPLREWGLAADATYDVYDALGEERFRWHGEWNYVRLEPATRPAHILKVRL